MILYFVLVGFATGAIGAGVVLGSGGGVLFALLAYSLSGALGVVLSAVVVALAPTLPRPRPRGGLPVGARSVGTRRVRVQAHASRR